MKIKSFYIDGIGFFWVFDLRFIYWKLNKHVYYNIREVEEKLKTLMMEYNFGKKLKIKALFISIGIGFWFKIYIFEIE